MTRGAPYRHVVGNEQRFRAVFEEMERDAAERIMPAAAAGRTDPAEQLRLGCVAFLGTVVDGMLARR